MRSAPATYDEIACVLANVKRQNRQQSILRLVRWLQAIKCRRSCPHGRRAVCRQTLEQIALSSPTSTMTRREFLTFLQQKTSIYKSAEQESPTTH